MEHLFTYYYLYCIFWSVLIMPLHQALTSNIESESEGDLFQGDIILSRPRQLKLLRRYYGHGLQTRDLEEDNEEGSGEESDLTSDPRWPGGRVLYKIDPTLNQETTSLFTSAMTRWTTETCIDFDVANDNDTDYVVLTYGCSAAVGREGGVQYAKVGQNGCTLVGNAIHELGHAIGLWHEHSRQDRLDYIEILWEHIDDSSAYWKNFVVVPDQDFVPDIGYDIASIMHYGPKAFSADGHDTINITHPLKACMDPNIMGQRKDLSFKDKLRVNLMYNCSDHVAALLTDIDNCLYTPLPNELIPPTEPPTQCKEDKNILSGTTVRLQFYQESQPPDSNTVYCHSQCKKRTNCMVDPSNSCSEELFEIRLVEDDRNNQNLLLGDTVGLRSTYRTSDWIDCSGETCELSYCTPEGSVCGQHQFELGRENQRSSSRIQTKDQVYLKAVGQQKYLNCAGGKCKLLAVCPGSPPGSACASRQVFSVTKGLECSTS